MRSAKNLWIALAVLPAGALAQVFPPPTGFKVHLAHAELVDYSRPDPFNDTHARRFMVSRFTPVPNDQCERTCRTPYMSPEIAKFEDDTLYQFFGGAGWPGQVLRKLELETCCEINDGHRQRKALFPTVLLDPGLGSTRYFYMGTGQHIASLGYDVILMDHTYETGIVQFPDGEVILGGRIGFGSNSTEFQFGLDVRSQDASFVLDTFKVCKAAFIGHSFGGATAANIMPDDPRIVGGVNLDGSMGERSIGAGVPRPFIHFGAAGHNSSSDPSWAGFWAAMDERHPDVWYRELSLDNVIHASFSDFSIIGDVTGLRNEEPGLKDVIFGEAAGKRVMEVLKAYMGDFLKFTLLHDHEGLLAEESPEFPDVHFLRENQA